jgi:outer membrane protein assembly factor BamB
MFQPQASTELHPQTYDGSACRAWRMGAWIAGVFVALLGLAMLVGHLGVKAEDPLKSPQLTELKTKLRSSPNDESTKKQIRELDLQLRERYFQQLTRMRSGVYLLFGGVAVFIFSVTQVAGYRKQPPMPLPKPDAMEQLARTTGQARWSVAAGGAVIGGLLFILSVGLSTPLPRRGADIEKLLNPPEAALASAEELRQNWPRFRGADGGAMSAFTNLPVSWDTKTGANILWKTPVPTPTNGFGSPIVWSGRVFFSSGDMAKRVVFCLDARTGQMLWQQPVVDVPGSPVPVPDIPADTAGYAAATMATDGQRVYVFFGNGDLAAFSMEGRLVWSKAFGALKNSYGHATSLATWRDRLILQLDQGSNEDGKSMLYALDGPTGRVVWQSPRAVGASWASPIVIEAAGRAQIITLAIPWVMAYAPEDGTELWRVDCLNDDIAPSPIFAGGLVMAVHPSQKMVAIRPDGKGDVTKSNVVWKADDNIPDITSPASNGELVFTVTSAGMLTCFDAKDGKKLWEHDYEMEFRASPAIAGNRLYLFSQKGAALVVETARQFRELFRAEMEDPFHASPAFVDGRIFLKGERFVWCLGAAPAEERVAKQK